MDLLEAAVPVANLWRGTDFGGADSIAVNLPDADLEELETAAVDLAAGGWIRSRRLDPTYPCARSNLW